MTDFTKYEYSALVEGLQEKLQNKPGWGDAQSTSIGQMLVELFADSADALMYMLDRRVQESYITTAKLDSSVRQRASELGYRARRAVSGVGTLTISLTNSDGQPFPAEADIVIPKFHNVTLKDQNIDFVTTEKVTIRQGQTTAEIPIKEGYINIPDGQEVVHEFYTSELPDWEDTRSIIIADYENIDEFSLEVYVNGDKFYDVRGGSPKYQAGALSYAMLDYPVYDIKYARDGMRIVFGDGINGIKPSGRISVNYITTNEVDTTIKSGMEFQLETNTLQDTSNLTPPTEYNYIATNQGRIRKYVPMEGAAEIAINAPINARVNERAVNMHDYRYLIVRSGIGDIVDAVAYGENELSSLIFNMNNIYVTYVTSDGSDLSVSDLNQLRDYLKSYGIITTHLIFKNGNDFKTALKVRFKPERHVGLPIDECYNRMKNQIEDYFTIKRGSIGKPIYKSELIQYLQKLRIDVGGTELDFIEFVDVDMKNVYELDVSEKSASVRIELNHNANITPGTIWYINIKSQADPNGQDYSVVATEEDDLESIVESMRYKISFSGNVSYVASITGPHNNIIRVSSFNGMQNIDVTAPYQNGENDLMNDTTIETTISIPSRFLNRLSNIGDELSAIPETFKIVDKFDRVLYESDMTKYSNGEGELKKVGGGQSLYIDYRNLEINMPSFPNGTQAEIDLYKTVYVTFNQNIYQNLIPSIDRVSSLMPLPNYINDVSNTSVSFIEVLADE